MFLNTIYVQKSKLMLYPLLGLDKKFNPLTSKLVVDELTTLEEPAIVLVYEISEDTPWQYLIEDLKDHPLIQNVRITSDRALVKFRLNDYKDDYEFFLKGAYSYFSDETKEKILKHYESTKVGPIFVDMHLNPEKYHEFFSDHFKASIHAVKIGHETMDKPDIQKETY